MAATYLTIGSRFRPFSYDELVRPLQEATQSHKLLEDAYSELSTKANIWENIADQTTDPVAYSLYKNYSDDLKQQVDILNSQGLTPDSRQNMMNLRARYSSDIFPIEQAYARRRELAEEQRKAKMQDPTIMFQRDVNTLSLDDFLSNPELDYGASYSGALLEKQAGDAAENFAKAITNNPRVWESILGSQYFQTYMQLGYTPQDILRLSLEDESAPAPLRELVNNVYQSSGIDLWGSDIQKQQAVEHIKRGMYRAIGTGKFDTLQNRNFIPAAFNPNRKGAGENPENKGPYQNRVLDMYDVLSSSYNQYPESSVIRQKELPAPLTFTDENGTKQIIDNPYSLTILYNDLKKSINDYGTKINSAGRPFKEMLDDINTIGYSIIRQDKDSNKATILINNDGNLEVRNDVKLPSYTKDQYRGDPPLLSALLEQAAIKGNLDEEASKKYNDAYKEIQDAYSVLNELDQQKISDYIFTDEDIASIMKEFNIPLDTDLKDFVKYTGLPYKRFYNRRIVSYNAGEDDATVKDLVNTISNQLRAMKSTNKKGEKNYMKKDIKSSAGIYPLDKSTLTFGKESIKRPEDIFETEETNGNITNIRTILLPPELVLRGYVGIMLDNGNYYAVPKSLFGNSLDKVFAQQNLKELDYLIRSQLYDRADTKMLEVSNDALPFINYNRSTQQPSTRSLDTFINWEMLEDLGL